MKLLTIGVYGWDEAGFFAALQRAKVDTFCDVRHRRGLRGHEYAFANSHHLQVRLHAAGIRYVYLRELSPSDEVRHLQTDADTRNGIGIRTRQRIDPAFAAAYERTVLDGYHATAFLEAIGPDAENVVLFCVEDPPEACHRWLLAARLGRDLDVAVEHIRPPVEPEGSPDEVSR